MRYVFLLTILFVTADAVDLSKVKWIHGSPDCQTNNDAPIQVVRYDEATWIMRQNKCTHYEAPFMFLFLGNDKALLMDTGAASDEKKFPLYATVVEIISKSQKENGRHLQLIVAHSHSHDDHWAGDEQFREKNETTVVGLSETDVKQFFDLRNWPRQSNSFDLGGRKLEIIPIPGHDQTSIAIYDHKKKLLLTGDTFYPGRLYVRDWNAFRASITRLVEFSSTHTVTSLLGNHIEMSNDSGKDYPTGATYQPNEAPLSLTVDELKQLDAFLKLTPSPERKVFDKFIVTPK